MEIKRCSCQDGVALEKEFEKQENVMTDAKSMRSLLGKLVSAEFEHTVFALTSVDRVCLLSQDDYSTPWWIIITPFEGEEFKIECQIPVKSRPWLSAVLVSEESSAEKACATVLQALRYSRGWDDSIGGKPIGLAELLDNELCSFRIKAAAETCRPCQIDWYNLSREDHGGDILVTVLFETSSDQLIGYRHDSPCATRWGLINLSQEAEDKWFWRLDDAFFRSRAWREGPPDDELSYFWKRSNEG